MKKKRKEKKKKDTSPTIKIAIHKSSYQIHKIKD